MGHEEKATNSINIPFIINLTTKENTTYLFYLCHTDFILDQNTHVNWKGNGQQDNDASLG